MPLFKFHGPYELHFPFLHHKRGTGLSVKPGETVELDEKPDAPGFSEVKPEPPKAAVTKQTAPQPTTPPDIPTTKKDG